jgi:hypothetical protein
MQIGGTLVNAAVRIAVLAATLALVYYFILRPVLDTTETVSGGIGGNIQKTFDEVNRAFDQAGGQTGGITQVQIKRQITRTGGVDQQKLINCIERAGQDINRIQRCANRFGY